MLLFLGGSSYYLQVKAVSLSGAPSIKQHVV